MFCRYCGKEINKDAKFCRYCGHQLQNSEVISKEVKPEIKETTSNNKSAVKPTSALPAVAMVLGILALVCFVISPIFAIPAIIIGILGLKYKKGMSISGIVMGVLSLLAFVLIIVFFVVVILANLDADIEGNWVYEKTGGSFNFYDNDNYYYYYSDNHLDNYCHGTYNVTDGYKASNSKTITSDKNYTYYTVSLTPTMCRISGEYEYDNNSFSRIFGISKDDEDKAIVRQNSNSDYEIKLKREK